MNNSNSIHINILKQFYRFVFVISFLGLFLFVFDYGYNQSSDVQIFLNASYFLIIVLGILSSVLRYRLKEKIIKRNVLVFDITSILISFIVLYIHFFSEEAHRHLTFLYNDNWVKFAIILTFIREFSEQNINFRRAVLDGADLTEGDFSNCDFRKASMVGVDLMKSAFDNADFRGADLKKARMNLSNFNNCKFEGADLRGIRGKYAIWQGSDWWNAIVDDDLKKTLAKKWPKPSDQE